MNNPDHHYEYEGIYAAKLWWVYPVRFLIDNFLSRIHTLQWLVLIRGLENLRLRPPGSQKRTVVKNANLRLFSNDVLWRGDHIFTFVYRKSSQIRQKGMKSLHNLYSIQAKNDRIMIILLPLLYILVLVHGQQAATPPPPFVIGTIPPKGDSDIAGGIFSISLTELSLEMLRGGIDKFLGTGSEFPANARPGAPIITGGTGLYPAQFVTDPTLPKHTIYAPKAPPDVAMPVIAWGNSIFTLLCYFKIHS